MEADRLDPYKPEQASSTKYTEPLLDTPQSISVIPEEVYEDQGATTLREVLRNVPGISIEAGEGNPANSDRLSIRGFSASDDIFLDGMRDVGIYRRDPFNQEAVEVSKGPASAVTGRGSAGGSVNLVSKTPKRGAFSDFTFGLGTDQTIRATADVNTPLSGLENAAFRFNLLAHDSEVADRDEVESQRWGIAPSLIFGLGTDTRTTLSYFHMTQDNLPDQGIPNVRDLPAFAASPFLGEVAPVDFSNFYGYTERDFEDVEVDAGTFLVEHDVSDSLRLRNQLRYQRTSNESIISSPRISTGAPAPVIDETTTAFGSSRPRDQVDDLFTNQTDVTIDFNTGSVAHTIVTGFEIGRQRLENRRRTEVNGPLFNLFNPDNGIAVSPAQIGTEIDVRVEVESDFLGLYALDTIKLNEQWQLRGSLRWDHIDTRVQGIDNDPAAPDRTADETRSDSEFSGQGAVIYKPRPNGSIYFGYGSSFTPLISSGTNDNASFQPAGGGAQGGAVIEAGFDVDPERDESFEIGTKWDLLDNRLGLTAAIFRSEKTDARSVDTSVSPSVISINGKERVQGFEVGVNGAISNKWRVLAAYTYLDGKVLESDTMEFRPGVGLISQEGQDTENTPKNSFNIWTTYQVTPKFGLGIGAQYVDERFIFQDQTNRAIVTAEDYVRFDALASYQVTRDVGLQLNLFNIFDEEYIESINAAQSIPGAGPSALLTVKYSK